MEKNLQRDPSNDPSNEKERLLKEAIETFFDYLNLREEPAQSDVIFILGGASELPAKKAAELYKRGYAKKIGFISTGGKFGGEKIWGVPENKKYRELLEAEGVPEQDIITQGLTSNTLAEAQEAIPFLRDRGVTVHRMILVSRPIHQRRAFATFKQQHPDINYINCPADEPLAPEDPETRQRLVQEAERLLDYAKKGDTERQDIPREVLEAAARIRTQLMREGTYEPRIKPKH
ncbi:hypothetical protein COU19_00525 [Candidatus Kaiserbacteria bacterium CG10_big_fil_rev_8_21_14_0_10_56_12]|uniref:DUF218 domain-containing protein n=1 Tax=Candidatus Kaiserbacteria bacterium CG10_big_fil_rev_8_21_14_0_10_56_12 TaxID=1974611 RepID=A0A2H0UAK9_9BACT|nr:MAG: hypothetical protein COU19_00525 [Candidatus Kaiserbacteria bacterium CG10_big_fil_rev_8_21_14_0_10_56_12]